MPRRARPGRSRARAATGTRARTSRATGGQDTTPIASTMVGIEGVDRQRPARSRAGKVGMVWKSSVDAHQRRRRSSRRNSRRSAPTTMPMTRRDRRGEQPISSDARAPCTIRPPARRGRAKSVPSGSADRRPARGTAGRPCPADRSRDTSERRRRPPATTTTARTPRGRHSGGRGCGAKRGQKPRARDHLPSSRCADRATL